MVSLTVTLDDIFAQPCDWINTQQYATVQAVVRLLKQQRPELLPTGLPVNLTNKVLRFWVQTAWYKNNEQPIILAYPDLEHKSFTQLTHSQKISLLAYMVLAGKLSQEQYEHALISQVTATEVYQQLQQTTNAATTEVPESQTAQQENIFDFDINSGNSDDIVAFALYRKSKKLPFYVGTFDMCVDAYNKDSAATLMRVLTRYELSALSKELQRCERTYNWDNKYSKLLLLRDNIARCNALAKRYILQEAPKNIEYRKVYRVVNLQTGMTHSHQRTHVMARSLARTLAADSAYTTLVMIVTFDLPMYNQITTNTPLWLADLTTSEKYDALAYAISRDEQLLNLELNELHPIYVDYWLNVCYLKTSHIHPNLTVIMDKFATNTEATQRSALTYYYVRHLLTDDEYIKALNSPAQTRYNIILKAANRKAAKR